MGEVIEPFNLKDERDGGHFDSDMNYVWSKERREVDTWLADLDEATMEKNSESCVPVQNIQLSFSLSVPLFLALCLSLSFSLSISLSVSLSALNYTCTYMYYHT